MDQITFIDDETGEEVSLFVLEETVVSEKHYLLVAESDDEESEAYIFREDSADDEDSIYVPVDDDAEFDALLKVFAELMDDTDFE